MIRHCRFLFDFFALQAPVLDMFYVKSPQAPSFNPYLYAAFSKSASHTCVIMSRRVTVSSLYPLVILHTAHCCPGQSPPDTALAPLPGAVADTDTPPRSRNQGSWRQQPANQGAPGPRLDQWEARPGSRDPGWSWRHLAPNQRQTVHHGWRMDSREQRDQQQLLIRATCSFGGVWGFRS